MSSFDKVSNDADSEIAPLIGLDKVAKRNGDVVDFDGDRIMSAIKRAGAETAEFDIEEATAEKIMEKATI